MLSPTNQAFLRFLVSGGLNTGITFVLFMFFSRYLHPTLAYTFTYLIGITFSYGMACAFVFRARVRVQTALRYPVVYLAQYLYGLSTLAVLDMFNISHFFAILFVIATSMPLTFIMARRAIRPAASIQTGLNQRAFHCQPSVGLEDNSPSEAQPQS